MIPIDPRAYTIRQLVWMSEGAQQERWSRTSAEMALLANTVRDPKKTKPFTPSDFDPFAKERETGEKRKLTAASILELKPHLKK